MKALRGVFEAGEEGKVLRLKKGLYGLKQAGRGWYQEDVEGCLSRSLGLLVQD